MPSIRITPSDASQYIGRRISFRTRNITVTTTLLGVTPSGHLRVDWADLGNLLTKSRKVVLAD